MRPVRILRFDTVFARSDPAQLVGVSGEDPRLSTKDFGERALTAILQRMGEKATELLDEYDAAAYGNDRSLTSLGALLSTALQLIGTAVADRAAVALEAEDGDDGPGLLGQPLTRRARM